MRKGTRVAWVLLLAGVGLCAWVVYHAAYANPEPEAPAPPGAARGISARPAEYPTRLAIASLGINANVQDVGVAKSGHMAVPSNYSDVGWYRYGPAPGQAGSMVFDGHVDNGFALPGVFKRLNEIKTGDEIVVTNAAGESFRYRVTAAEIYNYRQVPVEEVFSTSGSPRLALVTCDGAWISGEKTYDRRLVVYASLVP